MQKNIRIKKHFEVLINIAPKALDPMNNSAAKRINILRWMVRQDNKGVDLNMENISPASLSCP
jgi:hypothetical protein